jgi:hypothetical protein
MSRQQNKPGYFFGHWRKRTADGSSDALRTAGSQMSLQLGGGVSELTCGNRRYIWLGNRLDFLSEPADVDPNSFHESPGIYAHVLIDDDRDEIIVGADKIGQAALYYTEVEDGLFFSTSLSVLKNRIPAPRAHLGNWQILQRLGDIPGDETLLKGVFRLGYGKRLKLSGDRVKIETIWSPDEFELGFTTSEPYLRRNNELLEEACAMYRGLESPVVVLLSGGDDSRRVALAAHRAKVNFSCVSQETLGPDWWDEDTVAARMIAEKLGRPFQKIPYPDSDGCVANDRFGWELFDWETFQHGWSVEMFRGIVTPSTIMDGIGFDIAVNGHFYHRMPSYREVWQDLDQVSSLILGQRPQLPFRDDGTERVRGIIRAELDRLPKTQHALSLYYLLNHARRATGAWQQAMRFFGHFPAAPFFHLPLFEQSLQIDPVEAGREYLQSKAVNLLDPEIANMPSTRGTIPLEWKTDLRKTAGETIRKFIQQTKIRPEVYDVFDIMPARLTFEKIRSTHFSAQNSWRIMPMVYFSEFLNWLDRRDDPWSAGE